VSVAVTLKRVSSAGSSGTGTGDAQASRGFSGLRLPDSVVGRAAAAGAQPATGRSRAMTRAPASTRIGYFGKIPARSDFVKVADDQPVLGMLDDWLAQVMTRLPNDARWKLYYDASPPVSFAFVGPSRRHAVAGHLVASHDQSGRRFPFLMMRTVDVPAPASLRVALPAGLRPACGTSWRRWRRAWSAARTPARTCTRSPMRRSASASTRPSSTNSWQRPRSARCRPRWRWRRTALILGLGLLLQPVMHSRPAALQKSLVLPLPKTGDAGRRTRCQVAAFWLELVTPFIRRTAFDLVLFVTTVAERPVLVIGFGGAAAETLHGIVDPLAGREQQVQLVDNGWIDEQLGIDIDVRALASYLEQPMLPLRLARELFLKTFIGAAT
jgi:type VI secretion system protein ImpM